MGSKITDEELQKLDAVFKDMGIKEELKTDDDLRAWITAHRAMKDEPKEEDKGSIRERTPPRLPNFSGAKEKDSTPYEVWRYEVECMATTGLYNNAMIGEAIRRSLKGDAAKIAMRMGVGIAPAELIKKFNGLYDTVASDASILTQFYTSVQSEDEDVAAWAIRLEDTIQRVEKEGLISKGTKFEMLRTKLWSGLLDDQLKQVTRYKYDTTRDYDQLVVEIRKIEQEMYPTKKIKEKKAKSNLLQENKKEDSETKELLKKMGRRLEDMEKKMDEMRKDSTRDHEDATYGSRGRGHGRGRGQGRGYHRGGYRGGHKSRTTDSEERESGDGNRKQGEKQDDVMCYRCGQYGHLKFGCRVRLDHTRNLNDESPLPGGGQ